MRVLILALIIVAVAIFGFLKFQERQQTEDPDPAEETETAQPTTPDDSEEIAPETLTLPRFDIVRVTQGGSATIAGQADPNATVELLANGEVIATIEAGRDGAFADAIDTPLEEGAVELGLVMITEDGTRITSSDTIIIYVPERDGDLPVVLRTTPGGATEILQRATDPDPSLGPLAIDTIDYDDAGNAIFSGRAEPNSTVQLFANRNLIGQTTADGSGRWALSTTIRPGRYTLQVIQLDENGRPKFAIEVPFEQASRDDIVLRDGKVIVQPGNSLWVISRSVYGEGAQYTVIYEANDEQIRDPDLIYPGQIFQLPEEGTEETGDN